eukprot:2803037-Rhodomonas_salina.2
MGEGTPVGERGERDAVGRERFSWRREWRGGQGVCVCGFCPCGACSRCQRAPPQRGARLVLREPWAHEEEKLLASSSRAVCIAQTLARSASVTETAAAM